MKQQDLKNYERITNYGIDSTLRLYLSNSGDMLDTVILLGKDYTTRYIQEQERRHQLVVTFTQEYETGLISSVTGLLDTVLDRTIRPYIEVGIREEEGMPTLFVSWTRKIASFQSGIEKGISYFQ